VTRLTELDLELISLELDP